MSKTLNDFQISYHREKQIHAKIEAALKSLGDAWEYPLEFSRRAGVAARLLTQNADRYKKFIVMLPRRSTGSQAKMAWAGTEKFAKLLRQQITQ